MAVQTYPKTKLLISLVSLILFVYTPARAKIIYVDDDAAGTNDGSSWADAYNYLQEALAAAQYGDEIRVAKGIYTPDQGAGIMPGDREATFYVGYGVAVMGCYAGFGEPEPNARNIYAYKSVLSGDLNGDDGLNFTYRGENSYRVVDLSCETTIDGFTIMGGNANGSCNNCNGGGIMLFWSNDVKINNCIIKGNTTSGVGGGMYMGDSDATLINCVFSGNRAGNSGGGLFGEISDGWTDAWLINCTFSGNSAGNKGGGICMCDWDSSTTLTNCILWGNSDLTGTGEPAQILDDETWITYSCIQGWTGNLRGIGNIDAVPLFVDAEGADNVFGTEDDNLRLLPGSPCIDAGDNLFGTDSEDWEGPPPQTDLDGNPRIVNKIVDMGAYEGPKEVSFFSLSTESVTVPEGGNVTFTVALAANPKAAIEVSIVHLSGDLDITVESPATLFFDSSNYSQPQTVTIAAAEDVDHFESTALIMIDAPSFIPGGVTVNEQDNEPYPNILLVDAHAPGTNDGSSWTDAFNNLQQALSVARSIPEVDQIWVAQGKYKPAGPAGEREVSFHLVNGVAVKGGYAGFGEPYPDARDIDIYKTILSGDLSDNDSVVINTEDLLDEPTRAENSYHVVNIAHCDSTTILDGFTITGGNASGPGNEHYDGAGIYNGTCYYCISRAAVTNCIITGNSARGYGGGADNCDGPITNCTITGNLARYSGGGLIQCDGPITNCVINGNVALVGYGAGGGLGYCDGPITNCIFSGNFGCRGGGLGLCNGPITNCTISGNSAGEYSGGMYYCGPITNCIVWGNSDGGNIPELAQIRGRNPVVNYCCIQGWTGVLGGSGNIDAEPLFVDADGSDDIVGTEDDDLRLSSNSPCVDAGNNQAVPADIVDLNGNGNTEEQTPMDLAGNLRFTDVPCIEDSGVGPAPVVDMGAYEALEQCFIIDGAPVTLPEGGSATFTVALGFDPLGTVEVTVAKESGDADISVTSGATLTFDSSNYRLPQTVTLAAAEDADGLNSMAQICVSAGGSFTAKVKAIEQDNEPHINTLFVDARATGANNGSNWTDAFNDLQEALRVAAAVPYIEDIQIWVAGGIYRPTQPNGDREATFQLVNGVTLKGGYAGFGQPDPDIRDIDAYETILSGDINGDDGPALIQDFAPCLSSHVVPPKSGCECFDLDRDNDVDDDDLRAFLAANNYNENSYHVVTGSGTDTSAVLDGFTISAGNANGLYSYGLGGGMYNYYGCPTMRNCLFSGSSAEFGGGMSGYCSNLTLTNCTFSANVAEYGAGMFNDAGCLTMTKCTFSANSASGGGGGMRNHSSSATLTDCIFIDNSVGSSGAGIYNDESSPILVNCTFSKNLAGWGAGISNRDESNPTLIGCMFIGNSARTGAGALAGGSGISTNCMFIGNSSMYGGAVYNYNGEDWPMFIGCVFRENTATEEGGAMHNNTGNPTVTSCIFTGNKAMCGGGMYSRYYSRPTLYNCTFSGNVAQNGNAVACDSYQQKYPSNLSLTNCILWEAGDEIWNNDGSIITITYSDVQDGWLGKGNIDADPCFLEPGYWADANDPNIIMEPVDPNAVWIDGDYHLLPGSPCINAGDPDYEAEPNETDLDGKPRIIGRRVDMGAHEYSGPLSADLRVIPHTVNLASKGKWIICSIGLPEQYNVADIEPNSVLLEFLDKQIKADTFLGSDEKQVAGAMFNREGVQAILEVGDIDLTITGQLTDGIVFQATDTIKVINISGKY